MIIELVNNVYETLNLPEWTPALILIILASGFPLAIILSWFFDITVKGIVRTSARDSSESGGISTTVADAPSPFENSIAVLPFQDMSQERDQEYFCDGIAEEILNILANIGSLKVIARTSSFAFKNTQKDIREIGRILGVNTLLEGSIRKSGSRIRITTQLIQVKDGSHIWSEKFDRDIRDIFEVQDEISKSIVKSLKIKIFKVDGVQVTDSPSINVDAFLLYLKGQYHRHNTRKSELLMSIEYYEKAIQADETFAPGYIGIANAFWGLTFWGNVPPNQCYPIVLENTKKAQKLNKDQADIYYLKAVSSFSYLWNMNEAESNFRKALAMNPSSAETRSAYSLFLSSSVRHEEAIAEAKMAFDLSPMSAYYNSLIANAYNFAGKYDKSIEHCREFENHFPDHFFFPYFLGFALHGKSRLQEAVAEYERAMDLSRGAQLVIANLIVALLELGNTKEADRWIRKLEELSQTTYVLPSHFYKAFRVKGEEELAFKWYQRAIKDRDGFLPMIRIHPYRNLRIPNEPRYTELLTNAGL